MFQTISDCQHKVKRKNACLIQLTSTSLNLHANSQLFVSAPKIKAIVWLALQIILFSSELEGNLENVRRQSDGAAGPISNRFAKENTSEEVILEWRPKGSEVWPLIISMTMQSRHRKQKKQRLSVGKLNDSFKKAQGD